MQKRFTHAAQALRFKIMVMVFAMPFILIGVSPSLNLDRGLASVTPIKNWGIENTVANSHIHAKDAWTIEEGSRNVVVAVIDTGIDPDHADLKANLWHDKVTGIYGWDFTKDKANPIDDHSHGTHVAGIIGAALNTKAGISGVVHKVSIMPVKYYSEKASGAENLRNSIQALNWAIDHGAHIVNYSGGGPEFSMEEYTALRRARDKGVLFIVAAGNEHSNGDLSENYYYPCAYKLDNIVCVAATNIHNELLGSSNWGKTTVDLAAPGENILSTVPGSKYAYMSGSSQATAFVAGVAAMILSKNPNLKPQMVKTILRGAVDKISTLTDKVFAGGKLNAVTALALLDRQSAPAKTATTLVTASVEEPQSVGRVMAGRKNLKATKTGAAMASPKKSLKISNL